MKHPDHIIRIKAPKKRFVFAPPTRNEPCGKAYNRRQKHKNKDSE